MERDNELLRQFADVGAQDAFAELVRAKINLVYSAALRQVGGDAHLAQDVVQSVFLALACQARTLKKHPVLAAWLHQTTRFAAAKAMRAQRRWQRRETEANTMATRPQRDAVEWSEILDIIDEALHALGEQDRAAILLRFFEGRSHAEVGSAIGLSENSARMRVDRALDKLREQLSHRGVTSTAAAIGLALAHQPLVAAPPALAAQVATSVVTAATLASPVLPLTTVMSTSKVVIASVAAVAVFATGAYVGNRSSTASANTAAADRATAQRDATELSTLRAENTSLKQKLSALQADAETAKSQASKPTVAAFSGHTATVTTDPSSGGGGARNAGAEAPASASGNWRLLADLQKQKLVNSRISIVDGSGKLSDSAAKIFDLTPDEQNSLANAFTRAADRLEALERENAVITKTSNGDYVITVKAFPELGGQVYDELMKTFAQTLGPDRNAAFVSLAADQVDRAFVQFGATSRTVTVTANSGPKNNPFSVRDEQVSPGGRSSSTNNYKDRADLLSRVGTITKLLPPDL